MFRNGHPSQESHNNLRHRYQAWKEDQRRNGSLSNGQNSLDGLELSIHMPTKSSGNRFEVLRQSSPPLKSNDYPQIHRVRHGRGSKEAKRRRDARRNQRKLQAILDLDVQLSRDIDNTLTQAKISPPRRCMLPRPAEVQPIQSLPAPPPACAKPTPPQLPYFNFSGLDLVGDCPQLTSNRFDSRLSTPAVTSPAVSTWRPEQPLLPGKNIKWSEYPLFFDLSKPPEPALFAKPERSGRELQLWRPQATPPPKKQSRFFPSEPLPQPIVKLPPTSCKLHADDRGVEEEMLSKPITLAESLEQVVKAAETARKLTGNDESDKNAANLWKILKSTESSFRGDDNDLYPSNVSYPPVEDLDAAPFGMHNHRLGSIGMPAELDNTEIPYIHANCLTGHANERGSEPYPTAEEDITIFEAAAYADQVEEHLGGLNEMVMDPYADQGYTDALLAVLDMPPLPASPNLEDTAPVVTDPRPDDPVPMVNKGTQIELETSDAHFKSEKALFHPQPLMSRTPDDDLVDVATFLKMGHTANCWCNDCGEPPASLSGDTFVEDDDWMVYSSVDDQGWPSWSDPTTPNDVPGWQSCSQPMTPDDEQDFTSWLYPTPPDDQFVLSDWEWEWGTVVHDVEDVVRPSPYRPTWDEVISCKPSSVAHREW